MNTRILALAGIAALALTPLSAQAQDAKTDKGWQLSIGAGVVAAPTYLGDDDYQLLAIPNVRLTYADRFFASPFEGIGYNVINTKGWRVGPIAKYNFGRDEDGDSPLRIAGDKTDDLRGLGDIDGTVELGGFSEYSYGNLLGKIELRQGLSGHEGFIGEAALQYRTGFTLFGRRAAVAAGPKLVFGDDSYNSAYFDVNAQQSAASGLSQFDAEGGLISYGVQSSLSLSITDAVSLIGFAGYDRLAGDAADSSLVQERGSENQARIGVTLNYTF